MRAQSRRSPDRLEPDSRRTFTVFARVSSHLEWIRRHVPPELGDADGNNTVDIVDALVVSQFAAGQQPSPFFAEAADADCNGVIDSVDADLIAQYYVGLIPELVCPGE